MREEKRAGKECVKSKSMKKKERKRKDSVNKKEREKSESRRKKSAKKAKAQKKNAKISFLPHWKPSSRAQRCSAGEKQQVLSKLYNTVHENMIIPFHNWKQR
jgi:hypothetical protein